MAKQSGIGLADVDLLSPSAFPVSLRALLMAAVVGVACEDRKGAVGLFG